MMNRYRVWYEQTNTLDIEEEAKDEDEARHKADAILEAESFENNVKNSSQGYFEHTYIDEE